MSEHIKNTREKLIASSPFLEHFLSIEVFNIEEQRNLKSAGHKIEKEIDKRVGTSWGMITVGPFYRMASKMNLLQNEPHEHVYMSRNMDVMRALVKIGFEIGSPSDLGYVRDDVYQKLDQINFVRKPPYGSDQNVEEQRRLDQQIIVDELLDTGIVIRGINTNATLSNNQQTINEIPEVFRGFIQDLPLEDL